MVKKQKKTAKKAVKKVQKKAPAKTTVAPKPKNTFGIMPLGDRVVVLPAVSSEERTPSGFIIPDSAMKEKPGQGTVVAVGEGRRNDKGDLVPLRVKVGDVIMFSKYGFDEVMLNDKNYFVVSEPSILAIFK